MDYLYCVVSSLCYGIAPSIQKIAINNGASAEDVAFYCSVFPLLITSITLIIRGESFRISKEELKTVIIIGVLGFFLTDYFLDVAYTLIPVGLVTVIHFTYPTIVCFINTIVFREKFTLNKLLTMVMSVAGMIMIFSEKIQGNIGIAVALVSAFTYAITIISFDKSNIAEMNFVKRSFYMAITSLLPSLVLKTMDGSSWLIPVNQMFYLFVASLVLVIGNVVLSKGINRLGSSDAAFISTLEPIISLLLSMVLYKDSLTTIKIAGCVIIILSLFPIIREKS